MKPQIGPDLKAALAEFAREWAPHEAAQDKWRAALNRVVVQATAEGARHIGDRLERDIDIDDGC